MVEISIIIVSRNTKELLSNCLRNLAGNPYEVWVVDNHSSDGTADLIKEKFPWVNLVQNKNNIGFAKANNQVIKKAKGEYILVLNPDTIVPGNTLEKVIRYLRENEEVGVVTCRVELPDGSLDWASHRGFPTPWASLTYFLGLEKIFPNVPVFSKYHLTHLPSDSTHEIDSCTGAFMLVKRKLIDQVGLFDENFFMYGEDLDFCFRAKSAGWKIVFYPFVKIIHFKGVSSGIKRHSEGLSKATAKAKERMIKEFHRSMLIFYKKHFQDKYPPVVGDLIKIGVNLRLILNLLKIRFKDKKPLGLNIATDKTGSKSEVATAKNI